jgi:hypothetical protein
MGFSLGWLATRGIAPELLYSALAARPTGTRKPIFSAAAMGGTIPGGWHLIVMNRNHSLTDDAFLAEISRHGEAVACFVEEHVMYAVAVGWQASSKRWSIVHESEKGIAHLEVSGTPPEAFAAIRAEGEAAQRKEDPEEPEVDHVFDIPVAVAQAVTGFRHDASTLELDLEVLETPRKSWWKGLLGRN